MSLWHLSPEYMLQNWTIEKLLLMIDSAGERLSRQSPQTKPESGHASISDRAMFQKIGARMT